MSAWPRDLFAIVYIAKEHKLYVLECQRHRPQRRQTLALMNALGYHVDPNN